MSLQMIRRQMRNALILLLQIEPQQQLIFALFLLLFLIALNVASNAASNLLATVSDWLLLLSPLLLFVIFVLWLLIQQRRVALPRDPTLDPDLGHYPGLVAMLGIFNDRSGQPWKLANLKAALEEKSPDWGAVLAHAEYSNLQPLLEAVRHHDRDGELRHLWLISTLDLKKPDGNEIQGSHALAPLVERIIQHVCSQHVAVYREDKELIVAPDDVTPTYRALTYIYGVEAPRVGLHPYQIIADITGARATMTAGMILACAPRGFPLQYTSTLADPATKEENDRPQPQRLQIDTYGLLRHALQAVDQRLDHEHLE
jgi:hypothetical protein